MFILFRTVGIRITFFFLIPFVLFLVTISLPAGRCSNTNNTHGNSNGDENYDQPRYGWYSQVYDENSNSFPIPAVDGAAYTIDNTTSTVYMFGGYSYYSRNDLYKFTMDSTAIPIPPSSPSTGTGTTTTMNPSFLMDIPKGSWTRIHDMQLPTIINVNNGIVTSIPSITIPGPRTHSCLHYHQINTGVAPEPMLWLYGGRYYGSSDRERYDYNDVWMYTISTGIWTNIIGSALRTRNGVPALPPARSGCTCIVRGNSLIIYGGISRNRDLLDDVWAFHTLSRTWAEITDSSKWPKRSNMYNLINSNLFFREDPPPLYSASAIYLPEYDTMVLHGGRSIGVNGMVPNSYVSSDTYVFVFGDKVLNGTGWIGVTGRWISLPITGYSPPRAGANAFSLKNQYCTIGGTDYVGAYGDRLVDNIHCLEVAPLLSLFGLSIRNIAPSIPSTAKNYTSNGLPTNKSGTNTINQRATWRELSKEFLGTDRPLLRERAISGMILPNLFVYGTGSSYDTLLSDIWLLSIPPMDTIGAWSISESPESESHSLLTSYLAYAGTLIILISIVIIIFARRLRKRRQEIEEAEAAEMETETETIVIPPGQTENGGVDPTIVASLKTIRYVKHVDSLSPGKDVSRNLPESFTSKMVNESLVVDNGKEPDDIVSVVAGVASTVTDSEANVEKSSDSPLPGNNSVTDSQLPDVMVRMLSSAYGNQPSVFDLGTDTFVAVSTGSVISERNNDNGIERSLVETNNAQHNLPVRVEQLPPSTAHDAVSLNNNDPFDHNFSTLNEVNWVHGSDTSNKFSLPNPSFRTNARSIPKLLPPPTLDRTASNTAIRSQRSNRRRLSYLNNSPSTYSSNAPTVIINDEGILDNSTNRPHDARRKVQDNHHSVKSNVSVLDDRSSSVIPYTEPEYQDNESLISADTWEQTMNSNYNNDGSSSILTNYAVKSFIETPSAHESVRMDDNNGNNGGKNNPMWWIPVPTNSEGNHHSYNVHKNTYSSFPPVPFLSASPPQPPPSYRHQHKSLYPNMDSAPNYSHNLEHPAHPHSYSTSSSLSIRAEIDSDIASYPSHSYTTDNGNHPYSYRRPPPYASPSTTVLRTSNGHLPHPLYPPPSHLSSLPASSSLFSNLPLPSKNLDTLEASSSSTVLVVASSSSVSSSSFLPSPSSPAVCNPSSSSSSVYDPTKQTVCSICLGEYEDGNELLLLPCKHIYHAVCISKWLVNHVTCPLCKDNVVLSVTHGSNNTNGSGLDK